MVDEERGCGRVGGVGEEEGMKREKGIRWGGC